MTQEALKLALEFLEDNQHFIETYERPEYLVMYNDVIDKCKETLAQEQEPVAWKPTEADYEEWCDRHELDDRTAFEDAASLYLTATPPQRTWVDLTDEDRLRLWLKTEAEDVDRYAFARAIEAKLKELNT